MVSKPASEYAYGALHVVTLNLERTNALEDLLLDGMVA